MVVKPQGESGSVAVNGTGMKFQPIKFPGDKAEREALVARLFVKAFDGWVASESEPSFKPFDEPEQNAENDLDFTIGTSRGEKLMELVEFAPLGTHGPQFTNAPLSVGPKEKAQLACEAVQKKSDHQGGDNRFLLIYATEHGFWLDPVTIERMRRILKADPPKFDRVYYISMHDLESASVSEIFPGVPHHHFGSLTDEQMDATRVRLPHPKEITASGGIIKI